MKIAKVRSKLLRVLVARVGAVRKKRRFALLGVLGVLGSSVLAVVVNGFPSWYPILRESFTAAFSASIDAYWTQPGIRLLHCTGVDSHEESAINTLLRLRLTNTSSMPREIHAYHVELRTDDGWKRFGRAPTPGRSPLYIELQFGGGARRLFDATPQVLDRTLTGNVLNPGHSVRGWVLLNFYAGPRPEVNATSSLRIVIRDTRGDTTTIRLQPPDEDGIHDRTFFAPLSVDALPQCLVARGATTE